MRETDADRWGRGRHGKKEAVVPKDGLSESLSESDQNSSRKVERRHRHKRRHKHRYRRRHKRRQETGRRGVRLSDCMKG